MDKFLERPKWTQEKTENPNKPLTSEEVELVALKLPAKKNSGPDDCTDEFYQTFKELYQSFTNSSKMWKRR